MSELREFDGRKSLDRALAAEVTLRLREGIEQRGSAYLVVSGGTTPVNLFSLLARTSIDWKRVMVVLADERCVSPHHEDSNERLVREMLLKDRASHAGFMSLIPTLGDVETNIASLSNSLAALPRFDFVLLGMGEDAHTASLFPCAPELMDGLTKTDSALITSPKMAVHKRVSLSKYRLKNTYHGIIYIVGSNKKAPLR